MSGDAANASLTAENAKQVRIETARFLCVSVCVARANDPGVGFYLDEKRLKPIAAFTGEFRPWTVELELLAVDDTRYARDFHLQF
jgi:hypothetical protein